MHLVVTSPAPRRSWRELLEEDEDGLVSQSPEWLDALCDLRGYQDASRLYQAADGTRMVLPLVRRRVRIPGLTVLQSMPAAWGFGGPLASRPLSPAHIRAVLDDLSDEGALRVHIRPNPLHAATWAAAAGPEVVVVPRRAHVLDLSGGFETVWKERFTGSTRNKTKKAERNGVEVCCDTTGRLLPVFHALFGQSVDRWAGQQHEPLALARWRAARRDPLPKFEAMAGRLGAAFQVWVATYQGRPAAALVVLRGRNAHYTRGAMDKALAGESHANSLLHKLAIEAACEQGCRSYHMGESGDSEGLNRFKSRFGAQVHDYAEYRLERLPLTRAEGVAKGVVKRIIGFRDAGTPQATSPGQREGDASVTAR
ncbi:MAG: GNAT family N-acetyltransferase [Actinomycetota bacterium]|nr:GNAT family N-acetyltransferase [Actinomycetota bacterium]